MERNIKIIGHIQGKTTSIFRNGESGVISERFKVIIFDTVNKKNIELGYDFITLPFDQWDAMTGKKSLSRPFFEFNVLERENHSQYTGAIFKSYRLEGLTQIQEPVQQPAQPPIQQGPTQPDSFAPEHNFASQQPIQQQPPVQQGPTQPVYETVAPTNTIEEDDF